MVITILFILLGIAVGLLMQVPHRIRRAVHLNTAKERLRANAIVRRFVKDNHRMYWKAGELELTEPLWALASAMQKPAPEEEEWVEKVLLWFEMGGRI